MVKFITLGGFLGAGKTTTMLHAARRLQQCGRRVVVITNDQGEDLVDTATAKRRLSSVGEVTGGCFCCRFEDLVTTTQRLVAELGADIVIAESVGSCTDLTATVIRPLRVLFGDQFEVAPLTTVVDPLRYRRLERSWARDEAESDLTYLYRLQLNDADLIALNKSDLLAVDERLEVVAALKLRFPQAAVVPYSATRRTGLDDLIRHWDGEYEDTGRDLDVDYRRYGAAEAGLAWLNQAFDLSSAGSFDPRAWTAQVLTRTQDLCRQRDYLVGHAKLQIEASDGSTKASLTDSRGPVSFDQSGPAQVSRARVTLNARVECEPAQLEDIVATAVRATGSVLRVESTPPRGRSFKPGQPAPTHRILAGRG